MKQKRHERAANKTFEDSLRRYVNSGVHLKRELSEADYGRACRELWDKTRTDRVYAIKIFVDPLVDTQFQEDFPSTEPCCVLVARIDPDGNLIDAPPGYTRAREENVYHSHVVAGALAPRVSRKVAASPGRHLLAYFDILGFKQKLRANPLAEVQKDYLDSLTRQCYRKGRRGRRMLRFRRVEHSYQPWHGHP
jgi:hypothetical protein